MKKSKIGRRNFLAQGITFGSGLFLFGYKGFAQQERPQAIEASIVKEYVKIAHSDLDKVKEMLDYYPLLLNASWDWGGGDFETAIGAAGHMGHREYAEYLIGKGARYDIFVSTMMGHTEFVKSTIERFPPLLNSLGPHGFTLLHHAEKGGVHGEALYEYFSEKGLEKKHVKLY